MTKNLQKAIFFGFCLLFFLVPLAFFPKTSELFEFNKMVVTYFLTIIIVSLWLGRMIVEKTFIFRRSLLDLPLIVFLLSQIISAFFSLDPHTSIFGYYSRFNGGLLSLFSYSFLYWALVSNLQKEKVLKVIYCLLSSAVLVSLYAVLQNLGIDKQYWVQDVQNRVFSTLGQPNWLAAWIGALIPLTWALGLSKVIKQAGSKKKNQPTFLVWVLLSSLFFLVLLFTKSRSGILGFLASDFLFWGLIFWKRQKTKVKAGSLKVKRAGLIFHSLLLVIIILLGTPWTPSVKSFLGKNNSQETLQKISDQPPMAVRPALERGGTESGEIRKIVWQGALEIWKSNPLVGTGPETFAYAYYQHRPVEHNLVSEWDFLYNKAHNEYLNFLSNTGLLGMAGYLTLISAAGFLLYRYSQKIGFKSSTENDAGYLSLALFSGLMGILVSNFFGFSVVPTSLQLFLYPALAFAFSGKGIKEGKKKIKIDIAQKTALVMVAFVCLAFLYHLAKYWTADFVYANGKRSNGVGDYPSARETLLLASSLVPNQAIYYSEASKSASGLAITLFEASDPEPAGIMADLALEEADWAVALSPFNLNLRKNKANLLIQLSAFDSNYLSLAASALEEAISLAPTDAKLYYNLGLVHARIGETEEAIKILEKTRNLRVNYKNARFALALLYESRNENQKAAKELEYILTFIDPEDSLAKEKLQEVR